MAEIQSQQLQQKHAGAKRSKKLSTRVDLTPMVDLGFLLITFFVFTTSLATPSVMKLALPDDVHKVEISPEVNENMVITLVLKDDTSVGYYFGNDVNQMQFTNYGAGLRNVIMQKQKAVVQMSHKASDLTVLIKPTDAAIYRDVVAALDEMLITDVKTYMLLNPSPLEVKVANK